MFVHYFLREAINLCGGNLQYLLTKLTIVFTNVICVSKRNIYQESYPHDKLQIFTLCEDALSLLFSALCIIAHGVFISHFVR